MSSINNFTRSHIKWRHGHVPNDVIKLPNWQKAESVVFCINYVWLTLSIQNWPCCFAENWLDCLSVVPHNWTLNYLFDILSYFSLSLPSSVALVHLNILYLKVDPHTESVVFLTFSVSVWLICLTLSIQNRLCCSAENWLDCLSGDPHNWTLNYLFDILSYFSLSLPASVASVHLNILYLKVEVVVLTVIEAEAVFTC